MNPLVLSMKRLEINQLCRLEKPYNVSNLYFLFHPTNESFLSFQNKIIKFDIYIFYRFRLGVKVSEMFYDKQEFLLWQITYWNFWTLYFYFLYMACLGTFTCCTVNFNLTWYSQICSKDKLVEIYQWNGFPGNERFECLLDKRVQNLVTVVRFLPSFQQQTVTTGNRQCCHLCTKQKIWTVREIDFHCS